MTPALVTGWRCSRLACSWMVACSFHRIAMHFIGHVYRNEQKQKKLNSLSAKRHSSELT
jgi:hypothetical protein